MTRVWESVSCEKSVLGAKQFSTHVTGMAGARGSGTYDGNKITKTQYRVFWAPRIRGVRCARVVTKPSIGSIFRLG